ncbi:MAG: sensor domain-containing protein [Nakamurella multipartita]|jgi:hypothetical protein
MSIATAIPVDQPSGSLPARPPRIGLASARSWAELGYVLVDLVPAVAFFVAVLTLLAVGIGLSVIWVGVPVLVLALLVARFGALVQRSLARALLDLPAVAPGWIRPRRPGPVAAIGALLRDPAHWRAVAYHGVAIVLAPLSFSIAVTLYGGGLGAVSYPLWHPFLPEPGAGDGRPPWVLPVLVDTWPGRLGLAVIGLGVLWCAPRVVAALTTLDRILITGLLAARPLR